MNIRYSFIAMVAMAAFFAVSANAEVMDRPVGIKVGSRMTLKPYVSVSSSYDSNVDGCSDGSEDVVWCVNPGLGLVYKAESWLLAVSAYYQYNAYSKNEARNEKSHHAYGQDVAFNWTDTLPGEKGWSLRISEGYQKINQTEDTMTASGSAYGRDRQELKFAAALQRCFGAGLHADVNSSYYWLDYDNARNNMSALYGWQRWLVGGELGYAPSKWTDFLVAGSYQGYKQDNVKNSASPDNHKISSNSQGWTVQGGMGSFATERITYRMLAGWSCFEYGNSGSRRADGFTYTVSGNWQISDTWHTMMLANSYYQPNEREFGSSQRVDSLSWGLAHSMIRNKLSATLDIAYRREGHEYSEYENSNYDLDIVSFRLGLNYVLNRYVTLFARTEFRKSMCENDDSPRGGYYDYDRFRGTLGMRFTY